MHTQQEIDATAEALRAQGLTWSQTNFSVSLVRNAAAAERERIATGWDGCVHEGVPCNMDIGASIRAGELVPWVGGA